MRVYASVLGVLLTAGSGYLAQVAVGSAGFERLTAPPPKSEAPTPGEIWYGGVLDPITIEVTRSTRPAIAFGGSWMTSELAASQQAVERTPLARPKAHPIISDNVHASLGSMM